ncbi:dihydroorotase family protein [Mesorhizobium sp. WSM4887]|uniref:dihydroorotase n=1 Tax=Mesorhizobium sp. WSM4887 TaxID=3038543 RepID=UPI002416DE25|nr:dihydroorotase family protein [Mesorhizobium sp. WSM4887]MDG4889772.1 dihydroorotase family protein [Mesorhizobium sp. WSM4887]
MSAGAYDTLIQGAMVVTPDGEQALDVGLTGGRIEALMPSGSAAKANKSIDATGLHLLPGTIDIHFHIRAPAFPERSTVETETRAAAAGGVTTLFEMPLSKPCCASADQIAMRRQHFSEHAFVNFGLYGAPGDLSLEGMQAMADEGAVAFKIFTTPAPEGRADEFGGLAFPDEADQMEALHQAGRVGLPIVVHAESAELLAYCGEQVATLDPSLAVTHGASRPDYVEAVAVAKLLTMNTKARAKLHIAHVTSAATVDVLRRFKGSSDFSAETCPQYLFRTEEDVERAGVFGKVNPPIRTQADQDAIWSAVADGTIAHVTTDHAVFALAEKLASAHNFLTAPPGTPGVEFMLLALLNAVNQRRLSLSKAVALVAGNGARRFGLPSKGAIVEGADADLVLVNLSGNTVIDKNRLMTKARDLCQLYEGMRFSASIERTLVAGEIVFDRGKIVGKRGFGQAVRPQHATSSPLRSPRTKAGVTR